VELLIGCGSNRDKKLVVDGISKWDHLVTLDNNVDHHPDVVYDLNECSLPFKDNTFDEIHAYDVLEHTGKQGDWKFFFNQFTDFWRVLKPGGYLCAIVPSVKSMWAWGDPSHTRVIPACSLTFLFQAEYKKQVGITPMSDFRFCYKADFEPVLIEENNEISAFVLRTIK